MPIVRVIRAYETETVEIQWTLTNGQVYVERRSLPPRSVIEAKVAPPEPVQHGVTCPKQWHAPGGGYLHGDTDDGPHDVDRVSYCGRCHQAL